MMQMQYNKNKAKPTQIQKIDMGVQTLSIAKSE